MSSDEIADVVIVGAGPSGSVAAHTLATRGFKVVCLEQGDWVNPADLPTNNPEWELLVQQKWHHDPNIRRTPNDYPLDVANADLHPVMFAGVGGTSIYYGAHWHRLLPTDFRVKSMDGVADDWPISYRDLAPYYDAVDKFIGVSGLDGDPAYPDLEFALPPLPIGKAGMQVAKGMNKLGWHWWPGSQSIAGQRLGERPPCARWGTCEWGCPVGAKSSFDLTYWPKAIAAGATLITGARVQKITTTADGRADGAIYVDRSGVEHHQRAATVILAANAVGTARLLLLSDSPAHPNGLANSSGLVGRNLMLHPNSTTTGLYDEDIESFRGPAGQLLYSLEFYDTNLDRGFVRGSKWNAMPIPGVLAATAANSDLSFGQQWGDAFQDVIDYAGRMVLWAANSEDLPEESNRVTLSDTLVDTDGIPSPQIDYTISQNTERLLEFNRTRMQEAHEAAGAARHFTVDLWIDQPGHLMGTARMGTDRARSVTDPFGRAHDVDNLFIVDGSTFVTSGAVNPTATIAALALRTAEHIATSGTNSWKPE